MTYDQWLATEPEIDPKPICYCGECAECEKEPLCDDCGRRVSFCKCYDEADRAGEDE